MTAADFQPIIDQMRGKLAQLKTEADGIRNDNTRGAVYTFIINTNKWIDAWASAGVDRVLAGTEPMQQWIDDGQAIAQQLNDSYAISIKSLSGWWAGLEDQATAFVANMMSDVDGEVKKLADKVAELDKARVLMWREQQTLAPIRNKLDPAFAAEFFDSPKIKAASLSLDALHKILKTAQAGVQYLQTGSATIANGPDGKPAIVPASSQVGALGIAPVVIISVAVIATALATAAALIAYYSHETAAGDQAIEGQKLYLVRHHLATMAEIDSEDKAQADLNKSKPPTEIGSILDSLKGLLIALGIAAGVYAGFEIYKSAKSAKSVARAAA